MAVGRFTRIKLGHGLIGTDLGDGVLEISVGVADTKAGRGVAGLTGAGTETKASPVAAPAFRSQAVTGVNNLTSHVVTMPSGVVSGDFLIMMMLLYRGTGTPGVLPTTPAGWTLRASHAMNDTHGITAVYTRPADGTEGSTLTMTTSVAEYSHTGILAYSGSGGYDAIGDFGSQQTSTASVTVPSVTTTQANDMLVALAPGGFTNLTGTPASGWTERIDNYYATLNSAIYAMEKVQAAAGASATAVFTTTAAFDEVRTYTVAIKGT